MVKAKEVVVGYEVLKPELDGHQGQFVNVRGLRLHYVSRGSGRAVVFIHGNAGSHHDWRGVLESAARKYQAIAFDRPGHGSSERPADEIATVEVQARILREALNQLKIERPLLVGHSWGAALALSFALLYPNEASALLLLAPAAYACYDIFSLLALAPEIPLFGPLSVRLASSFLGRKIVALSLEQAFAPDSVPSDYLNHAQTLWTGSSQTRSFAQDERTFNWSARALSARYREIQIPTLILTGDSDSHLKPEHHSHPLHEAIPHSKLIVLKEAGHQLPHTRRDDVLAAIDQAWEMADKREYVEGKGIA